MFNLLLKLKYRNSSTLALKFFRAQKHLFRMFFPHGYAAGSTRALRDHVILSHWYLPTVSCPEDVYSSQALEPRTEKESIMNGQLPCEFQLGMSDRGFLSEEEEHSPPNSVICPLLP